MGVEVLVLPLLPLPSLNIKIRTTLILSPDLMEARVCCGGEGQAVLTLVGSSSSLSMVLTSLGVLLPPGN